MYYFLLLLVIFPSLCAALPVKVVLNDWTSQRVVSLAFGQLLTTKGKEVEYIQLDVDQQAGALKRGAAHLQLEVWYSDPTMSMQQDINSGKIQPMGQHQAKGREDWWYPTYVKKLCPGLPQWQALNKCTELFALAGSDKGIVWTGNWSYHDHQLIRALGLNFKVNKFKNVNQLWQKLQQAVANQTPILLFNWTPNWTNDVYQGEFVAFPEHQAECETDPSWGINRQMTFDCGNPKQVTIGKAAWTGLAQHHPCVAELLSAISFDKRMLIDAAKLVQLDGHTEPQAARLWLDKYKAEIQNWLASSCLSK